MKKFLTCAIICVLCSGAYADNERCLKYKITPRIDVTQPQWHKEIKQSDLVEDSLHGNVESVIIGKFGVNVQTMFVKNGFCVWLDNVYSEIGYDKFVVNIDEKYAPDGCEYNAVLNHEDKHISAHLDVIDSYKKQLHDAIYNAANSVMPVFVSKKSQVDDVIENFHDQIQNHPEFILLKQQISTDVELKNKSIDENEDGHQLKECIDKNF